MQQKHHTDREVDNVDPAYDTTFIEPPDTPAPQFAVKAFKHAIFGTPAPEESNPGRRLEKKAKIDAANSKATELPAPKEAAPPVSPSKGNGILRTPLTANKSRKTVSFGAQVVDNEGKKGNMGKSGIPNDCPGKFPSPWTPGTELKADPSSDKKPRTKLTEALYDARTITQPKSGQKLKARDDSDITIDLGAPRSESGKYWKEQYEKYAERSEKEVKQLVARQQMAKQYAKKKDGEAMEAATRLAEERKRFRSRERELEQQNKEYQERLRQAMADNFAFSVEITALKNRIAVLEKPSLDMSSGIQNSKMSFQIYEDSNKDSSQVLAEQEKLTAARSHETVEPPSVLLGKSVTSSRLLPDNKENSPPKLRRRRGQTLPEASATSHTARSLLGTENTDGSALMAKSDTPFQSSMAPPSLALSSKSSMSARKSEASKGNLGPKSPAPLLSSPLPQASPDPWMGVDEEPDSPAPAMDRLALPIGSGASFSKPARSTFSRHRASKSLAPTSKLATRKNEDLPSRLEALKASNRAQPAQKTAHQLTKAEPSKAELPKSENAAPRDTKDIKFDLSNITAHHAEDSSQIRRDRAMLPIDRKALAKQRLQDRKQRRAAAS
jgi:hypothetical protein